MMTNLFTGGEAQMWATFSVFPMNMIRLGVIRLEQNYCSHRFILDAANGVILHNQERLGKSLWTDREDGPRVELDVLDDARDEARYVARRIREMCTRGEVSPTDIAVLMRANHLSLDVESSLRSEGVAYRVLRGACLFSACGGPRCSCLHSTFGQSKRRGRVSSCASDAAPRGG